MAAFVSRNGNMLTESPQGAWLVHQCNCMTRSAAGLAKEIFAAYPAANTYRQQLRVPGTIYIAHGTPHNVINLYGQQKPGRADATETHDDREMV